MSMIKNIGVVAVLIAAVVFGLILSQDASAQSKIGFVDQEKLLREAAPAKRAQAKLEKEFSVRKAELDKVQKQGRDLEALLLKEAVTLPEADKIAKERQLAQVTRDFQRLEREYREDFNLRRNEEIASLQERFSKAINDIAEKEGFDIILQEAVYSSTKSNITEKVVKALADK